MAQVYIFNATPSAVIVSVNGGGPRKIYGVAGSNGYSAPVLKWDRGPMPEPEKFGSGTNRVTLMRDGGMHQLLSAQIGGHVRPEMDLQLYLFSEHAVLVAGGSETSYNLDA